MLQIDYLPTPANRYVLVKPFEPVELKSQAGLFLQPTTAISNLIEGVVLAVDNTPTHENERRFTPDIMSTVLFYKQSGASVYVHGIEHFLVKEDHLMGSK